jgi:hypothetical protein
MRAFSGGIADAFTTKLDSKGKISWNTFLGGSGFDDGFAIAVDGNGNIYVGGYSTATWGEPVRAFSGGQDAFVAKLYSTGKLTKEPISGTPCISGMAQVGSQLTVDVSGVTPSEAQATFTYQWQKCATADGTYTAISGATSSTYTLSPDDFNQYIEVQVTGTGPYTATLTSTYVGPIMAEPIRGLPSISGKAQVGSQLTVDVSGVTPSEAQATLTYQWQKCATADGTYTAISGATSRTYIPTLGNFNQYIEVQVTGMGPYTGILTSAPTKISVNWVLIGGIMGAGIVIAVIIGVVMIRKRKQN